MVDNVLKKSLQLESQLGITEKERLEGCNLRKTIS